MIFNYKTISISREVELDFNLIKKHAPVIIRSANIGPGGVLIHDEVIDPSLIIFEAESPAEQEELNKGISLELGGFFYYDSVRQKYLSNETKEISFYLSGNNQKNQYMYLHPAIPSNVMPYHIFTSHCIVAGEWTVASPITVTNQNIISLMDNDTQISLFDLTLDGTFSSFRDTSVNIDVLPDTKLSVFLDNVGQDSPVVKIYLKEIAVGY